MQHTEGDANTTAARADWLAKSIGPQSRPLLKRDAGAFLHQNLSSPCVSTIAKTEGNDMAERIYYRCLNEGLSFKTSRGCVLTLSPPLTIERDDLDRALTIVEAAITAETP